MKTPAELIDWAYLEWLNSDDVAPLSETVLQTLAYNGYEIVPRKELDTSVNL